MQQWSQGLNVGADILLYACLTAAGSAGEALLNNIASTTGADVAGSTNLTGHSDFGADWALERSIGSIEAKNPFEAQVLGSYRDTLAVFTAANGNDAGAGSLRQAILDANGAAGDDEIRFAPGLTQVTLTTAQLDINTANGDLTIDGDFNGAANVIVERSNAAGTPDFRIFNLTGNNNVTFDALTIRNGNVTGNGGGIRGDTFFGGTVTVTLTNSTVSNNSATGFGGGISADPVILINSNVSDNTAVFGGGIFSGGPVILTNITVSGNTSARSCGGIYML
jgi:predicted outer membrane repeat protein